MEVKCTAWHGMYVCNCVHVFSLSGCPRARKSGIKIPHGKEDKEDQEPIRYRLSSPRTFLPPQQDCCQSYRFSVISLILAIMNHLPFRINRSFTFTTEGRWSVLKTAWIWFGSTEVKWNGWCCQVSGARLRRPGTHNGEIRVAPQRVRLPPSGQTSERRIYQWLPVYVESW